MLEIAVSGSATLLPRRGKRYDWAEEQEWRVVGNVALQGIGAEDLFVFVPDEAAGGNFVEQCRYRGRSCGSAEVVYEACTT